MIIVHLTSSDHILIVARWFYTHSCSMTMGHFTLYCNTVIGEVSTHRFFSGVVFFTINRHLILRWPQLSFWEPKIVLCHQWRRSVGNGVVVLGRRLIVGGLHHVFHRLRATYWALYPICEPIWRFPQVEVPPQIIVETHMEMDDLGVPPIYGHLYMVPPDMGSTTSPHRA